MNDDTATGKFDQIKGKVKQSVGEAIGNDRMANSGAADQVKGAAKESWGATKDAFHDVSERNATVGTTADADTYTPAERDTAGHDVRQRAVSSAENVKETIKEKVDQFRRSA